MGGFTGISAAPSSTMEGKDGSGDTDPLGGAGSAAAELSSFPSCVLGAVKKFAVISDLHLKFDAVALASRTRNSQKSAAFDFYLQAAKKSIDRPVVTLGPKESILSGCRPAI